MTPIVNFSQHSSIILIARNEERMKKRRPLTNEEYLRYRKEWQQAGFKDPLKHLTNVGAIFYHVLDAEDFKKKYGGILSCENVLGLQFWVITE